MEITTIEGEMYSYFERLTEAEKKYFTQMIKNFLLKREQDELVGIERHNRKTGAEASGIEPDDLSQDAAADIANGWLHGK